MSDVQGLDLVDAITEWVDRADEDLDEHDIEAILRIQLAVDDSRWSGVAVADLTQGDVASLKHHLDDVDAPEFTSWVVDETLAHADVVPPRGPARKAPSGRGRRRSKTSRSKQSKKQDSVASSLVTDAPTDVEEDPTEDSAENEAENSVENEAVADQAAAEDEDDSDAGEDAATVEGSDRADALTDPEDEAAGADEADSDAGEDLFDAGDGDAPDSDDADEDHDDGDDGDGDQAEVHDLDAESDEQDLEDPDDAAEEPAALGGIFAAAISDDSAGGIFAATTAGAEDATDIGINVDSPVDSAATADPSDGFFAELERNTTASVTGPAPIELRDAPDSLGPSFLPPSDTRGGAVRRLGIIAIAAVALAAFVFAGIQLVNNVNQPAEDDLAVDAEGTTDVDGSDPDAVNDPDGDDTDDGDPNDGDPNDTDADAAADDDESDDAGDSGSSDDGNNGSDDDDDELTPEEAAARLLATPEPTPEEERPPAEKVAIVLTDDGDIWSIDLYADGFGDPVRIHDSADHPGATDVSVVSAGLGVVDDDGDAHIVSRDDPDERVRVWRSDRLGDAETIVEGSGQYAVLDATGSISLFEDNRAATQLSVDTVWDTSIGGTPPARDIDNYIDLIAFAVGDGDVQLIQTSADDNPVFPIWDGESQPRAFNVHISDNGLLMGVAGGAIARYQWFEDGPPLSAVWDPLSGTRLPAISYAPLEDGTAVVLNNGSVATVDESGDGPLMWDAEVSDLRAVNVTTLDDEVLLVLDGGTVLRVAADGETQNRGSIWDVTDESTSPAIKVLITKP